MMSSQLHVLTLELKDDLELIRLYEQYHQPGKVWPEVLESIRAAGIEDMQIFRLGTFLVMLMTTNNDFSFEKKSRLDNAKPKVQEWERLMEKFQRVGNAQPEHDKWRLMRPIFSLVEH